MGIDLKRTAPICVFAFNRPEHLYKTLEALLLNDLATESDTFVFCDGPRSEAEKRLTDEVRRVAYAAHGFKSLSVVAQEKNQGLATSIITGVTKTLQQYGSVIVVEDDLVASPYFLRYMNDGLQSYAESQDVASIHGWCFPHNVPDPPETFFLPGADCWGWATWKRAWDKFEPDAGKLLTEINRRGLSYAFDLNGAYGYTAMLKDAMEGTISSWAIRWYASMFLAGMYTLYPGRSLIHNIGLDASGTHCCKSEQFSSELSASPICVTHQDRIVHWAMQNAQRRAYLPNETPRVAPSKWKATLKRWTPLPIIEFVQRLKSNKRKHRTVYWEGDWPDWERARAASDGYDDKDIFKKVFDSACAVRDGRALWDRDSVLFYHQEYNWPLLASLMTMAAKNSGRLSVVDFGGALVSTYAQHKAVLDTIPYLTWNIIEQPHFVRCGQQEFETHILHFWSSIQKCAKRFPPDVIIFSSVLQYVENPYDLIEQAISFRPGVIILDRTPFLNGRERITVQYVPKEIYSASYPCRWLDKNRVKFILANCYIPFEYRTAIDPPGFSGFSAIRR